MGLNEYTRREKPQLGVAFAQYDTQNQTLRASSPLVGKGRDEDRPSTMNVSAATGCAVQLLASCMVHGRIVVDDIVRAEYTSRSAALHSTGGGCYGIEVGTASSRYKNLQDLLVHGVVGGFSRSS